MFILNLPLKGAARRPPPAASPDHAARRTPGPRGRGLRHRLLPRYVRLEALSSFAFQGDRWLTDLAPDLLPPDVAVAHAEAKVRARRRQAAEARRCRWVVLRLPLEYRSKAAIVGD